MFKASFHSSVLKSSSTIRLTTGLRGISLKPDFNKLKLIPPPPGGVNGTVNDKLKTPNPDFFHGSYHWDYERITAISLIPLTMIPLYAALSNGTMYPMVDASLCSVLLIHAQLGFTSCIIDYIPKRKFGVWHTLAMSTLYLGSALGLYGVYELETSNNGLVDLISKLWKDDESNVYVFGGR
ncbi:LAFE_0D06854g1_1 [Lachancea fermentati]|uniref:Succinate dehydrogenase [ubiquinone] cytochrome b small subunit n=1 Tax=Lachancea fermentati TaxID=4955 RepID=A0A1G4MBD7_LACFM|nr:LAFE_0D06854g1_1 [Lachancea fermentati]